MSYLKLESLTLPFKSFWMQMFYFKQWEKQLGQI